MDKDLKVFLILNIVILVCGGIIMYYLIIDNVHDCTASPLIYGAEKIQEDYGLINLNCDCYAPDKRFSFNTTSYYIKELEFEGQDIEIENITKLFENIKFK